MLKLSELFEIQAGNDIDFKKMTPSKLGISFVSRTSKNNGVVCNVKEVNNIILYPKGAITVSLGGAYVLSSFVQYKPFYAGAHIDILVPKSNLTFLEKCYYCTCIVKNRFRYSAFGREAHRTLRSLLVPNLDEIPNWVHKINIEKYRQVIPKFKQANPVNVQEWKNFKLIDLFNIRKGKGKRLTECKINPGNIPVITTTASNNGISCYTNLPATHEGSCITIANNGSIGETFYQEKPFMCSSDNTVLVPKFSLNKPIALFLCTIIRQSKLKYNYGRKWNMNRMKKDKIKLPVKDGQPDWEYMENFIERLK